MERIARGYEAPAHPADARPLPLDVLVGRFSAANPEAGAVSGVTVSSSAGMPVTLALPDRRVAYVDAYTGALLGDGGATKAFFASMERLHRSMALSGGVRNETGVKVTGAANLLFLFLVVSGLYLWFPRRWSARGFRAVGAWSWRAKGRARDWNWHHVAGVWSLPVLFLIVGSATFISYKWPMAALEAVTGDAARQDGPAAGAPRPADGPRRSDGAAREGRPSGDARPPAASPAAQPAPVMPAVSLDTVFARATALGGAWRTVQIRFPRDPEAPVTATVARGGAGRPDLRTTLSLDAATGAVTKTEAYADLPRARQLRSWVRPVHTGEAAGVPGQTLAMLASAAGVLLVWTGFSLALRRFQGWRKRRAAA
jgi:uncharacterized iron-regulated membrane protein